MSFAAPVWIGLAALASLAVVAIHLIAWRLPRTVVLPTARFVPDEPARRAARTVRLADLALLALRVAVVMVAGLAMARPVFDTRPTGSATVIAVDGSIRDSVTLRDSIRAISPGTRTSFVVFDTAARVTTALGGAATGTESSLSVGLLAAIREASRLEAGYDTVRVALVSTFTRSSFDNATRGVRSLWPDSIRLVRIAAGELPIPTRVEFATTGDDPVAAGVRLALANGLVRGESRLIRDGSTASPDSGRTLVIWPQSAPGAAQRIDAVHAGGVTAIGVFNPASLGDSGRVIARWKNGAPAAREISQAGACIRTVGFDVPDVGDFVLTPSFQRLAAELLAPCGQPMRSDVAPDSVIASLVAPSPGTSSRLAHDVDSRNRVGAILMVLAIALGVVELLARRSVAPVIAERGT